MDSGLDADASPRNDVDGFAFKQANCPCLRQTRRGCAREQSDEAIQVCLNGRIILDCFASLAMTSRIKHRSTFPRRITPECCMKLSPLEIEGAARPSSEGAGDLKVRRRESRVLAAPAASCVKNENTRVSHHRY